MDHARRIADCMKVVCYTGRSIPTNAALLSGPERAKGTVLAQREVFLLFVRAAHVAGTDGNGLDAVPESGRLGVTKHCRLWLREITSFMLSSRSFTLKKGDLFARHAAMPRAKTR